MPLNDPPLNVPPAEEIPDQHKSRRTGASPDFAAPTDVYVPTSTTPVERIRMQAADPLPDGTQLYLAADGSGRVFKKRQHGNLGVEELTPDEYVTLAGRSPDAG